MKKYKIAHSQTIKGLGERVEKYLNNGWELHGTIVSHGNILIQSMVKTEGEKGESNDE